MFNSTSQLFSKQLQTAAVARDSSPTRDKTLQNRKASWARVVLTLTTHCTNQVQHLSYIYIYMYHMQDLKLAWRTEKWSPQPPTEGISRRASCSAPPPQSSIYLCVAPLLACFVLFYFLFYYYIVYMMIHVITAEHNTTKQRNTTFLFSSLLKKNRNKRARRPVGNDRATSIQKEHTHRINTTPSSTTTATTTIGSCLPEEKTCWQT